MLLRISCEPAREIGSGSTELNAHIEAFDGMSRSRRTRFGVCQIYTALPPESREDSRRRQRRP